MKSEASLMERLTCIARGAEKGNPIARVVWTILPRDPTAPDLPMRCFSVNDEQRDEIVSEMFDLSLRGYYVAHVSTQGWGEYREIWFKIRKSDTHQTNITNDTISAFLKVLEPTLKGGR